MHERITDAAVELFERVANDPETFARVRKGLIVEVICAARADSEQMRKLHA
jgi:hypothetical protein